MNDVLTDISARQMVLPSKTIESASRMLLGSQSKKRPAYQ